MMQKSPVAPADVETLRFRGPSFSPVNLVEDLFVCVGNTSGDMKLAALGKWSQKACLARPMECGDCLMIGRRK